MKYNELIQFDALETIIKLTESRKKGEARKLVETYVISETMADRLINIVFQQLQYDRPVDNKGLLVVGNYGTGKSHLMSVISALASDAGMVQYVKNADVAQAAAAIAGKFKVIRTEIGGVKTSLRDIIVGELEKFLNELGIDFSIPDEKSITNNKIWIEDMMAAFNAKYPDHGFLFVLDELLDYLRSRRDQELVLDLGLLRELGEVCEHLRFRFIAGVQEAIFDSTRFSFVSDSIRRVHERFEQVDIARNDVKYVVSERLLKKTPEQQQIIKKYLDPFAKFYGDMSGRMDEFVRMFPVHPDYIEIFERVAAVENRTVLKTLSVKMSSMLDCEIPAEYPGIVAYDSYWATLTGNASFRTIDEVRKIMECVSVLETKINHALPKPYRPMAQRIISALAVNRLTTGNIYNNVGITAAEMRDTLCLFDPVVAELGGEPDAALQTQIETIMGKIMKAVSGQFITKNADSHQYFIDVQRTEDIDALIEQRAASLDDEKLDHAFFEALKIIMEVKDVPTKVTGYNIWEYDKIIWHERNAPRIGYLFFGAPNERSTAQPPRDYYLYFLKHFSANAKKFKDEKKSDEIFFRLVGVDDKFTNAIRNFAGALDLSTISSGPAKTNYERKVFEHQNVITAWLREKNTSAFEITYQGQTKETMSWLKGVTLRQISGISGNDTLNFRDMVNAVTGYLMAQHFNDQAPDYPKFSIMMHQQSRAQAVSDALRMVAGGRTKQATALLDALGLLDVDRISVANSSYAKKVLQTFQNRSAGQVVNRSELIVWDHGVEYFDVGGARLEPDFLVVVLAALVYTGEITLTIVGRKFDATMLNELAAAGLDDLISFKHIEQPKEWNQPGLSGIFALLSMSPGYTALVMQNKETPVKELQTVLIKIVDRIVRLQSNLRNGINFLGVDLLATCGYTSNSMALTRAKEFLEYLQNFDTPAKLKNFKTGYDEIMLHAPALAMTNVLEKLWEFYREDGQIAAYLPLAEGNLPAEHPWIGQERELRRLIADKLSSADSAGAIAKAMPGISQELRRLKREYVAIYLKMHQDARLSVGDETRRNRLLNDPRIKILQELTAIEVMPRQKLSEFQNKLNALRSCTGLSESALESAPLCPCCNYSPRQDGVLGSASELLKGMDEHLDTLLSNWVSMLLSNMEDPITQANLNLLKPEDKVAVKEFIKQREIQFPTNPRLIPALREIMNGLQKITLNMANIEAALQLNGPARPEELKQRFSEYVDLLVKGKDQNKIRIVLE